jgi:hypothetical protein
MTRQEAFDLQESPRLGAPRFATGSDGARWYYSGLFRDGESLTWEYFRKEGAVHNLLEERLHHPEPEGEVDWVPGRLLPPVEWQGPFDSEGRRRWPLTTGEWLAKKQLLAGGKRFAGLG